MRDRRGPYSQLGTQEMWQWLSLTTCCVLTTAILLLSQKTAYGGLNAVDVTRDIVGAYPINLDICSGFNYTTNPPIPKFVGQPIEPPADACYPASKPIPVIGVSVVHDPRQFLSRLVNSIDYPVENIVIAFNGQDLNVANQAHALHRDHPNITLIRFNRPQGCAEGWNAVIQATPNASWHILPNYDTFFPPGQLQKLAYSFPTADAEQAVLNCLNCGGFSYSLFAVKQSLIQRVGLFDENIYPAYWEDQDWQIRLIRAQPPVHAVRYINIFYMHGLVTDKSYISGQQRLDRGGNATKMFDRVVSVAHMNKDYFAAKWGCKFDKDGGFNDDSCPYTHPFNNPSWSVAHWSFDMDRRKKRLATMYGEGSHQYNMSFYNHFNATTAWTQVDQVFNTTRRQ